MVGPAAVLLHADDADGNGRWRPRKFGRQSQADAFKRIVKKEPKYQSENPFRGVIKFGSQEYAFALDAVAGPQGQEAGRKEAAAKAADETASPSRSASAATKLRRH